jgi:DNA-binding transcriptional ArsR family regulator
VTPGAGAARRAPVTEPPPDPDALLRALAEPQRRRIVQLVGDGELPAGAIADQFAITPQAVSQHLRVLKDAGLLRERRDGTRRLYALRPEAIASVRAFLDDLWPSSLARLRDAVQDDGT